ncbi:MAG TPA: endolytic transglycosylase MltG [Acidimicrobiales bacterium]|nr:endolytic transglycosylase MltG [Acidimicrobiales bacterium]
MAAEHTRRSVRRRRTLAALGVVGLIGVGLLAWAVSWYEGQVNPGPRGPAVVIDVPQGASVGSVASKLSDRGVISSSFAFRLYLFLHGTPVVHPGRYLVYRDEDYSGIHNVLAGGPDVFEISVPPGFTVAEVAGEVGSLPGHDQSSFLKTARSGEVTSPYLSAASEAGSYNLDGLLGTGTYLVLPGERDATLLRAMVTRFNTQAAKMDLTSGSAALGYKPYQVITIASIVQKEALSPGDSATATAFNAPRVARVIYNRLAAGTPLQDDSTVLYAEGRDGGTVTSSDLNYNSPYNTYEHSGLTPTPICFPSALAFQATLHPQPGSWMYFVLTSRDGTETFSDTFTEQVAAEQLAHSRGLP